MCEEGVIKFESNHRDAPLIDAALAACAELLGWRRIFVETGLLGQDPVRYGGAGFGNLSARLPPYPGERGRRRFVITGSQTSGRVDVSAGDFTVVERYDVAHNRVVSFGEVPPSSESLTHGAIYDLSPRIRYVLHVHTPDIFNAARAWRLPATAADIDYGTVDMAREMARLYRSTNLAESRVLVMAGHEDGVIAFGRTADEAALALLGTLARSIAEDRVGLL